jgi:hypothetical protein
MISKATTVDDVRAQIAELARRGIPDDDADRWGREASLYEEVLEAIAAGSPAARTLATEALKVKDIDYYGLGS